MPVRGVAAAHVLQDHGIAALDRLQVNAIAACRVVLAVGRAKDEYRKLSFTRRPVDVRAQRDAVAHRDRDVAVDFYLVGQGAADESRERGGASSLLFGIRVELHDFVQEPPPVHQRFHPHALVEPMDVVAFGVFEET